MDEHDENARPNLAASRKEPKIVRAIQLFFSVELSMFLLACSNSISATAQQKFTYYKLCMYRFDSNETLCAAIDSSPELMSHEGQVQADFALCTTINTLAIMLPAAVVTLIMGSWADRFSFLVPMSMPHIGYFLNITCYMIVAFLPVTVMNPIYYGLFGFFQGVTGNSSSAFMIAAAYIGRSTTKASRTTRMAFMDGANYFGNTMGYILYAFFLSSAHFELAFLIQMAINMFAIFVIYVMIPELHNYDEVKARVGAEANGSWFKYIFALRLDFLEGLLIIFGKSSKYAALRPVLIGMLVIFTMTAAIGGAMAGLMYPYLSLQPISISLFDYSILNAVNGLLIVAALIIGIPLLKRVFQPSDATFGIIGVSSRLTAMIALALGGFYPKLTPWLYCVLYMGGLYPFVAIRSGVSKVIDESHQGRVFSALSVSENLLAMLVSMAINAMYGALVSVVAKGSDLNNFVHGLTFLISAVLYLIPLSTFIWLGFRGIPNWSFKRSLPPVGYQPLTNQQI